MSAHAYWRVLVHGTSASSYVGVSEIAMRATPGGANLMTGGTLSVSAEDATKANLLDGNTSTYWQPYISPGTDVWISYHFASAVDVVELSITPRTDAASIGPGRFEVQYSDDGSTWITVRWYSVPHSLWTSSPKVFDTTTLTPDAGGHRYWRIKNLNSDHGTIVGYASVKLLSDADVDLGRAGNSILNGFVEWTQIDGALPTWTDAAQALDDSLTTYTQVYFSQTTPAIWQFDFGLARAVGKVAITTRQDAGAIGPTRFTVEYSDDGSTWTVARTNVAYAWSTAERTFLTAARTPVANGHKWWRINTTATQHGVYYGLAALELRASAGGSNLLGGPSAGAEYDGWLTTNSTTAIVPPLVDGVLSTYSGNNANEFPITITCKFDVNRVVKEVALTPRQDAISTGPGTFTIEWSDDGVTWYPSGSYSGVVYADTSTRTFAASGHRYWRLYVNDVQGPTKNNVAIAELELRETPGGPDVTGSGTASASSTYSGLSAANAVNNDGTTTIWAANNVAPPGWWAYDLGAGVAKDITEVWMQARNDTYYNQTPTAVTLQYSDNGTDWTDYRKMYAGSAWTAGSSQVLLVNTGAMVAKAETYALLQEDPAVTVAKAEVYAIIESSDAELFVSKSELYVLLEDQDPFAVDAVAPASGSVGTNVTLQGTGFAPGATVTFNGIAATNVVVVDELHITCTVPSIEGYMGLVDIVVTQGVATSSGGNDIFTYLDPWRIETVAPNSGYLGGGEELTIGGAGFDDPALIVLIGGMLASVISIEANQIVCLAPPRQTAGVVTVTVVWTDGKTRSLADSYTYLAPGVSSVVPNRLSRTGGTATVHGGGFVPGAVVELSSTPVPTTYVSSTELTINVPDMPRGIYDVGVFALGLTYTTLVDGLQLTEPPATRKTTMFPVA